MWRSQAAHLLWEQGVGGSNPPIPTRNAGLTCGYAGVVALQYLWDKQEAHKGNKSSG